MYGILLTSIQQSIIERYGDEQWQAVFALAVALGHQTTTTARKSNDDADDSLEHADRSADNEDHSERCSHQSIIFHAHQFYPDDLMLRIGTACTHVLRRVVPLGCQLAVLEDARAGDCLAWPTGTPDDFLRSFGHSFVGYTSRLGFDRVMGSLGRYFRDFLANIDNLHETMRFTYRKMVSPSFYITDENKNGCILHYR